jgi:hypothetical protein
VAAEVVEMSPVRTWFSVLLIAVGGLWLADAAGLVDAGRALDAWWPLALVLLAVITAAVERRVAAGSVVLGLIGLLLLLPRVTGVDAGAVLWACAAILVGAWLLARYTRRPGGGEQAASGTTLAVFSGARQVVHSDHFRHADVSAVFGGATLDLREAHPDPGARVDATAVFGGVDVLVPPGWRVELSGLPLFGGYDDRTRGPVPPPPDAPVLRVVATAVFGGVTVKSPVPV